MTPYANFFLPRTLPVYPRRVPIRRSRVNKLNNGKPDSRLRRQGANVLRGPPNNNLAKNPLNTSWLDIGETETPRFIAASGAIDLQTVSYVRREQGAADAANTQEITPRTSGLSCRCRPAATACWRGPRPLRNSGKYWLRTPLRKPANFGAGDPTPNPATAQAHHYAWCGRRRTGRTTRAY